MHAMLQYFVLFLKRFVLFRDGAKGVACRRVLILQRNLSLLVVVVAPRVWRENNIVATRTRSN